MKAIFALQGKPNTGKSTTIGILFNNVPNHGFQVLVNKRKKNSKDFFVVVRKNNVNIGLTTYGDTAALIKSRFNFFLKFHCQILVCGCHLDGATVSAVLSFKQFEHRFVLKNVSTESSKQTKANQLDAKKLLDLIEGSIIQNA